ncbi:MAG TPA: LytTR family DNA-binding domain-containing protein [Cyclobacteriaceae bacterium]|jgi:DNA-binding LytR/AlgR family response regulator|nr:LytTR family DNA-binding domain-containing protein [Cyclobacteriaceae bacterium]
MKVVIIEDEKLTARDLAATIRLVDPDIEILAMIGSVEEAIPFLQGRDDIDLIFSDIQLSDGLSFTIFESIKNNVPVIFCTAYLQYAIEAFNSAGIDYILKPFSEVEVNKALQKYQNLKQKLSAHEIDYSDVVGLLKSRLQPEKIPSVIIHLGDRIIPLDGATVAIFYIVDKAVIAQTFEGKEYVLSQQLDKLESTFNPFFFRVNRQFLINRKAVKEATVYFNRKLLVNLTVPFKEQIQVGKVKVTSFLEWLSNY